MLAADLSPLPCGDDQHSNRETYAWPESQQVAEAAGLRSSGSGIPILDRRRSLTEAQAEGARTETFGHHTISTLTMITPVG